MMEVRPWAKERGRSPVSPFRRGRESLLFRLPNAAAVRFADATPLEALDVQVRVSTPDELTVHLRGELDLVTAELLSAVLRSHADRRVVRLDISRLSFVDCAGLHAIEAANTDLSRHGGQLVLTGAGPRVCRVLRLTGLEWLLSSDAPAYRSGAGSAATA